MILVHIILFPFLWPLYLVYFTIKGFGDILFPDDRLDHANEQAEKRLRSMGTK